MSVLNLLQVFALVGIPVGLALGSALGLVAARDDGWGGYGSFPRRATRLGHVAAVMLPLLAGFYALGLEAWGFDPTWAAWGARLWTGGAAALVVTLFVIAWRPRLKPLLALPSTVVIAGAVALAVSVLSAGARPETPAAPVEVRSKSSLGPSTAPGRVVCRTAQAQRRYGVASPEQCDRRPTRARPASTGVSGLTPEGGVS